ncbi:MAG: UDP-4-amino-4,6-dideoxy-N-acetyl-beta-L-altrosamine transaminase [Candidatus Sericytochromatia bacterium]|nr:UDP-4-amino-4,6-dideoxy-N-acetyl-beta-L-altrosamine transaminase [Candidatus Sericytochromatia bacterium]
MYIPYGRQDINNADIEAVVRVLQSDFLTQGEIVPAFENAVAEICQTPYAVAVNSATSALHLACMALDLGPKDLVWTTPISFVASANCARYCGAEVDFVDIDPHTYNLSVDQLKKKLKLASLNKRLPKIVIPVHFSGQACEMKQIHSLGEHYGFNIIEDASHAIGGRYLNSPIGTGEYSDITVFSFHPVKIITTGEGGMALTRHRELFQRMKRLRTHGIVREPDEMPGESDGPWFYQQIELGYNYRLTDLQAALGLSQMTRLETFIKQRHFLASRYDQLLATLPVITPWQHPDSYSGLHLYVIRLKLAEIQRTRLEIFNYLRSAEIGVNIHYIPIYRQAYYAQMGFQASDFPESEKYYAETLTLPLYPTLTEADQDRVVQVLKEAFML